MPENWKYAEVCFPNTCLTNDNAYAQVIVRNNTAQAKTYQLRLFYQNTSYWYPTGDAWDLAHGNYLDNYYGTSKVVTVKVTANSFVEAKIPYTIGMNPKGEFDIDPSKDPARPGNYEFLLLALPEKDNLLMSDSLDLKKVNPFAEVKMDQLNGGKKYFNYSNYVGPHHFKFVFLDEYFDKVNDLAENHIYLVKDSTEKRLCDTCTGWYKGIISEFWKHSDFMDGYLARGYFVRGDYGIRKENFHIDSNGIDITIPKSTRGDYKKTWGEFLFGPSFKYGHLTVRAKFSQMMNKTGTPNGIIHNLWLYQRDRDPVDTTNPAVLRNAKGEQPYEIDFEIWSATEDTLTIWDPLAFITYSVVDYMRDSTVKVRPHQSKRNNKTGVTINRTIPQALAINGAQFDRTFFDDFHTYELYWYPDKIRFLVDGYEKAVITKSMAKIPDRHLFLWIGSPMYQDGTYYAQSIIPFLKDDKHSIIDYIKIE